MHELGYLLLLIAFVTASYSVMASLVGAIKGRPRLLQSGVAAAFAVAGLLSASALALNYLFVAGDFSVKYVHHYSDSTMPTFYLLTSIWGGQAGSLLFWAWILAIYSAAALYFARRHARLIPYATATLMATVLFFLTLLVFEANPFEPFLGTIPGDGKGLNPLLQNPYMAIHPPTLYLGYIGMSIPFAFGIAALASGQLDQTWMIVTRWWTRIAWLFLSVGLILGKLWAYEELGWGGYWAWDPVENAGFLPWLTCTAFMHSSLIQERRPMFRNWNMSLVILSFIATLFGTYLTRSGVVQSVHSFAQSTIGPYFLYFMGGTLVLGGALMFWRRKTLASEAKIESLLSREFTFSLNNWILLGMTFFVTVATLFPSITESLYDERITVGQAFFNRWMIPLGLTLLFLTGVGPLISWRRASTDQLKVQFTGPIIAGLVTGAVAAGIGGLAGAGWAILTYVLCGFVTGTILQEFWRGTRVRMKNSGEGAVDALFNLVAKAKRRYGGYVIHFGIVLMFFGWAGNAYKLEKDVTLARGESAEIGGYTVRYDDFLMGADARKSAGTAMLSVLDRGGETITTLSPAKWTYAKSMQPTTEVSIRSTLTEDLYLILTGWDSQSWRVVLRLVINPFTVWVWVGSAFLIFGLGITLWPQTRRGRPRALGAAALLLALGAAPAPAAPALAAPQAEIALPAALEAEAQQLHQDLICPCGTCERETLHACTCGTAAELREEVRRRLQAGANRRQILDYFVARFGGNQVLAEPPPTFRNSLIVVVPFAGIGVAAVLLFFAARRWRAAPTTASDLAPVEPTAGLDADTAARYQEALSDALEDLD